MGPTKYGFGKQGVRSRESVFRAVVVSINAGPNLTVPLDESLTNRRRDEPHFYWCGEH